MSESDIEIQEVKVLIDTESNKILNSYHDYEENHTYICKKTYELKKGYKTIKTFNKKEEAEEFYNKIVNELRKNNNVIDIW